MNITQYFYLKEGMEGVGRLGWRRRRKEGDKGRMTTIQNKGGGGWKPPFTSFFLQSGHFTIL